MPAQVTTHAGLNGKGADLLSLLLGAKIPKAAGFPVLLQKKVVEGAKPECEPAAGHVPEANGTKKRGPRAEEKKRRQELPANLQPLPAIQAAATNVEKVGVPVPLRSFGSKECRDVPRVKTPPSSEHLAQGETGAVARNAVLVRPGRLIDAVGRVVEEDRPATKNALADFEFRTPPRQDDGRTEPPEASTDTEEDTSASSVRSEQSVPENLAVESRVIFEVAKDVSIPAMAKVPPEVPSPAAGVSGSAQIQTGRLAGPAAEPLDPSREERTSNSAIAVSQSGSTPLKVTDSAVTHADGADTNYASKKARIEAERVLASAAHDSPSAATSSGVRAPLDLSHGTAEAVPDHNLAGTGDPPMQRTAELQPSPAQPPVAFHSVRLTEHIAGPELHFNWRSPDSGDIQLSTSLHRRDVQMIVNTEKPDTAAAMRAELPSLDHRLHEHSLRLGEVNIVAQERNISTGLGMSGQDRRPRDWSVPSPLIPGAEETLRKTTAESMPTIVSGDGRVSVLA